MKTQDELKAHYRDVIIPMVAKYNYDHGTDVKPWECVRLAERVMICHPKFEYNPDICTFAITILEGGPVFAGDKIYSTSGTEIQIHALSSPDLILYGHYTRTPPKKRTFMLNGVELPCPVRYETERRIDIHGGDKFYFESHEDHSKFRVALNQILTEARDKE